MLLFNDLNLIIYITTIQIFYSSRWLYIFFSLSLSFPCPWTPFSKGDKVIILAHISCWGPLLPEPLNLYGLRSIFLFWGNTLMELSPSTNIQTRGFSKGNHVQGDGVTLFSRSILHLLLPASQNLNGYPSIGLQRPLSRRQLSMPFDTKASPNNSLLDNWKIVSKFTK